ncbi:Uncharacterised protein [Escherichia coli]|nr:Uncharacterised protein [Escherichia coli]
MTKTRNKSVYNHGRKVHIDYLHGVTLCYAIAFFIHKISGSYLTLFIATLYCFSIPVFLDGVKRWRLQLASIWQ